MKTNVLYFGDNLGILRNRDYFPDELEQAHVTIEKWNAGDRYPRLDKPILDALDLLLKRNRIPKMKRYAKGSR